MSAELTQLNCGKNIEEIGKLSPDTKLMTLGDCLDLIIDHRGKTPKKLGGDWTSKGIKAISAKNVHGGKLSNQDEIRHVTNDIYKKWMKEDVKKGDCLLVSEGATLGEHLYWDYEFPIVLSQRLFCLRVNDRLLDSKYFYAFITSDYFQNQINGRASGTSVFGLRQSELLKMLVPIIPLNTQKLIGDWHYSVNKKIDLLHRQNKTLEAMAETLFRQWVVVEAGEDWEEKTLADYADHLKDGVIPANKPIQLYTHYSLPSFDNGMKPIVESGSEILSNKYGVQPWTILVSKLNPRFPRIWPIGGSPGENAICSTEFQVFKPKDEKLYGYLYFLLKSNEAKEELSTSASGTSGSHQRVRPADILNLKINLPSTKLAEQYSEFIMPNIKKLMANLEQIHTLETLRDTLLPKLMSGEVRVDYTPG